MIRAGTREDLGPVAAIQADAPEAAQWPPADYLDHAFLVAERAGQVAGFAVFRSLGDGEFELLNIAVGRAFRRQGIARDLIAALPSGRILIEVRASNNAARRLYEYTGFRQVGMRRGYYRAPDEDGIVLELQK